MKKLEPDSEEFLELIRELQEHLVIVEGKKDVSALRMFEVTNVITVAGRTLHQVVFDLKEINEGSPIRVVILTDFDPEGRKLASKLRELLQGYGITPNSRLRRKVMQMGKTSIEDLKSAFPTGRFVKEDDFYGKISTDFNEVRSESRDKNKRSSREA